MADVGKAEQDATLQMVLDALPEDHGVLLLGSTAAISRDLGVVTRTKDVDIALVLLDAHRTIAPKAAVMDVVEKLAAKPLKEPDDHSWVQIEVVAGGAVRQVDIIRGKSRDRPNGVFIARNVLQAVATAATRSDRVFVPTLTGLVVLKAWAAVDQARRAELPEQNRELCLLRSARYADDARRYGAEAQRRGELDLDRIQGLLALMAPHRRGPVTRLLAEAAVSF